MRKGKKLMLLSLIIVMVIVMLPVQSQGAAKFRLKNVKNRKMTMYAGDTFRIKSNISAKKLKFTSSNKKVAKVGRNGKITAKKKGTCKIKVTVRKNKTQSKIIRLAVKKRVKAIKTETENRQPVPEVTETAMQKEKISLYGDDGFKQEILKNGNDTIVPDAIYVSVNGSDSNSGSDRSPFRTIQKALNTVEAGQTIYVREGTYTACNTFRSSGKEGGYVTLRNYPGENPYLTMRKGESGAILSLDGNNYIKIEGLEIGGFTAKQAYGILLDANENHIIIRNNKIHNICTTEPGENEGGEANAILCYGFS